MIGGASVIIDNVYVELLNEEDLWPQPGVNS
jgi:hypothetical protein